MPQHSEVLAGSRATLRLPDFLPRKPGDGRALSSPSKQEVPGLRRTFRVVAVLAVAAVFLLLPSAAHHVRGAEPVQAETNLALGLSYWLSSPPSPNYPDGGNELTNGVKGSANYTHPAWQGHLRDEFRVVTFDLGAPKPLTSVRAGFLYETGAGIYLPEQVLLYTSVNGHDWSEPLTLSRNDFGQVKSPSRVEVAFTDLNRTARYVRLVFFTEVWVFIDEVEIFGEDRVVDVDGPTDLLDMNDPYLGLSDVSPMDYEGFQLPETALGTYFPPGHPDAAGVRHLMLIYTHSDWTVGSALPYVAYAPRGSSPFAPAQWSDWFFDSFLFLALVTPDREHAFDSASRGTPARWEHWMWFVDYLFEPGKQLDAFEEAVARAKQHIDDPDYKAKVVIMIPYPIPSTTDFGDPLGTGQSLSFARFPQGDQAQLKARLTAIEAYLAEIDRRWAEKEYEHLELVGLYWLAEGIETSGDFPLLEEVVKLTEERGLKLFWIPYFTAPGWNRWQEAGFHVAIYQPNYMFNWSIPLSRFEEAATRAKRYGMGVEIEADGKVFESAEGRARYLAYLDAGVKYGYMTEAIHGYYQGVDILLRAFISTDPEIRYLYDATYQYVKGTYEPKE